MFSNISQHCNTNVSFGPNAENCGNVVIFPKPKVFSLQRTNIRNIYF